MLVLWFKNQFVPHSQKKNTLSSWLIAVTKQLSNQFVLHSQKECSKILVNSCIKSVCTSFAKIILLVKLCKKNIQLLNQFVLHFHLQLIWPLCTRFWPFLLPLYKKVFPCAMRLILVCWTVTRRWVTK